MRTSQVVDLLDKEFRILEVGDPYLVKHAVSDTGRAQVTEAFLQEKSGLMFDFTEVVSKVYCVVFTTREVLDRLLQVAKTPSLLFTHHPHDYREDTRGVGPFPEDYLAELKQRKIAVYTIHNPLDVGLNISVSKSLAQRLSLSNPQSFSEACGGHLGVMGSLYASDVNEMAQHVCRSLNIDTVDVFDYGASEGPVAVVAGGGDQPRILEEAKKLGCRTYITGTVVHRWKRQSIQDMNREFHRLARQWKINLIGANHHCTERCAVEDLATYLRGNNLQATFLEDPILGNYIKGNRREQDSHQSYYPLKPD